MDLTYLARPIYYYATSVYVPKYTEDGEALIYAIESSPVSDTKTWVFNEFWEQPFLEMARMMGGTAVKINGRAWPNQKTQQEE